MLLSTLLRWYRKWRRYDQGLNELGRLTDRELADIGISRTDIYRIAWDNAQNVA
jgi:uncharacterized protein YjiS (DUF1127 family)